MDPKPGYLLFDDDPEPLPRVDAQLFAEVIRTGRTVMEIAARRPHAEVVVQPVVVLSDTRVRRP